MCDEIQSIRTFFLLSVPPAHTRVTLSVSSAPLSGLSARERVRIDKKPMGRIKKKKVLLFLNTLKVARWFILFLSSALRFIDRITISTVFFPLNIHWKRMPSSILLRNRNKKVQRLHRRFSEIISLITSVNYRKQKNANKWNSIIFWLLLASFIIWVQYTSI